MSEQNTAATENLDSLGASGGDHKVAACMQQAVGESAPPTTPHMPSEAGTKASVSVASSEGLQPSVDCPNDLEGANVLLEPHNDVGDAHYGPWEDLTGDGKVLKRTLQAGSGDALELHSVCLVHYVGSHKEDGSVFVDTKAEKSGEPISVVAGRELVKQNQGVNMAVARMLVGEVCEVEVMPEYGYGEKGNFSFPCVKPNATLSYHLELVAASPPADKRKGDMFFEERLEAAQRLRLQGNELFRREDFQGSLNRNKIGMDYIDEDLLFQLQGHYLDDAHAVKAPLHLNSAACYLKLEDWSAAATEASECLKLVGPATEDLAPKALFRRAKAYAATRRTEDALKDLQKAKQLRPTDKMVVQEIARVRKQLKEQDAAVADLFRNKLPAGSNRLSDPAYENPPDPPKEEHEVQVQDTPGAHMGSSGAWEFLTWFISILQGLLSIISLNMFRSGPVKQKSS